MENKIIYQEKGKPEHIVGDFYFLGYNNGSFVNDRGETVLYSSATFARERGQFEVAVDTGHTLENAVIDTKYNCAFSVTKKKIRLIRLSTI